MSYARQLIHQANLEFSSQYAGLLANHLPMVLVALERMGAVSEQLDRYYKRYSKRLKPRALPSGPALNSKTWTKFLGQNNYQQEYCDYFHGVLATDGVASVLATHLPTLFRGVAGGAFHGLIRLGYALESENEEEIYEALAYWAISYLDLGADQFRSDLPDKSFSEMLGILHEQFDGAKFKAENIAERMSVVCQTTDFRKLMLSYDSTAISLSEIAAVMVTALCNTRNFTILHGVTSTHALRLVAEYCSSMADPLYYFTFALAAAFVTIGAPSISPVTVDRGLDWNLLISKATRSLDDHIPKIVYTCKSEHQFYNNPEFFEAAFRYINGASN